MRSEPALVRVVAGGLAAATGLGLLCQAGRRRRVLEGRGDERLLTVRSGNRLAYRFTESPAGVTPRAPRPPVAVCLSGTWETMEHWAWVTSELSGRRAPVSVLTYDRPGYGRSRYGPRRSEVSDTTVADLMDLITHVCEGRRIVLVGHGAGAGTALHAVGNLTRRVCGVVLVEPVVASGNHSVGPASASPAVSSLLLWSLRAGWGCLMATPRWMAQLPHEARSLSASQYRDAGLWRAGAREAARQGAVGAVRPEAIAGFPFPVRLVTPGSGAGAGTSLPASITRHRVEGIRPGQLLVMRHGAAAIATALAEISVAAVERGGPS